jgi:glutamyl-tRNA reductase
MMTEPSLTCIGISHRTAPLALREQLSCEPAHLYAEWAGRLPDDPAQPAELVLLSTCNRLELYLIHPAEPSDARAAAIALLSDCEEGDLAGFEPYFYTLTGRAVIDHLCCVAAGLESQVLGEAQILGQVVEAYSVGLAAGAIGPYLSALFQTAIRAGKRTRAETAIGRNPVSLSSAAIAAAHQIFPDLRHRSVLVVGAGEMAQLAVKSLLARGVRQIAIANRTLERARLLAASVAGRAFTLDQLPHVLSQVDVVISATGAPHTVIDRAVLEATALSSDRRLLFIDIALPRDVDPQVRQLPGVRVMDMDDLKRQVDQSLELRQAEKPRVLAIIAEEKCFFESRLRHLDVKPVITDLRQKAEAIRQKELDRAIRRLGPLDDDAARQLDRFSRSLVNKLLHDPTVRLRDKAGREQDMTGYVQTVRDLFGLEEPL